MFRRTQQHAGGRGRWRRSSVLISELQEKAEKLITVANDNGGKDNIAVVLVDPQIGREGKLMILRPGTFYRTDTKF